MTALPAVKSTPKAEREFVIVPREPKKEADQSVQKLLGYYYNSLSSADTEFPYWYTRRWDELEGTVLTLRRAEALKKRL